jgi:hypothetical protein
MYLVAATFARPYDRLALKVGSWKLGVLSVALLATGAIPAVSRVQRGAAVRTVTWEDVSPLHRQLQAAGLSADSFPSYVQRVHDTNVRRVAEGDLDHLVFYLLQSARFTTLPPIEPALSAKGLVDSLADDERAAFLRGAALPPSRIPAPVRSRVTAFVRATQRGSGDQRLAIFRTLVERQFPDRGDREAALGREYLRAMRFVYEKEFIAPRTEGGTAAVAALYRARGLSTDTAAEAGFLVHEGLGVVRALDPSWRVRRVLVIGPGLDLAPRTALIDDRAPESYQPWALIDSLLALGLASADDLQVVAADINPRVVEHLRRSAGQPPVLTLVSEVAESDTVSLSAEYREYFQRLGSAAGTTDPARTSTDPGRLRKIIRITPQTARLLHAAPLDIVTERLAGRPFDLVVATNILPYFDDVALTLAMSNVASMIAAGGMFLHNEPRPLLGDVSETLGLRFLQSRHAIIATVRGARAPLSDSVFIHRKERSRRDVRQENGRQGR